MPFTKKPAPVAAKAPPAPAKPPPKPVVKALPPPPEKGPLERLMVMFDYNSVGHILHCQGVHIEPDAREEPALAYHGIAAPPEALPGSVLVYEVEPARRDDGSWSHSTGGRWREPASMEWASLHTAHRPKGGFYKVWKDIPEGPETELLNQARIAAMCLPADDEPEGQCYS